MITALGTTTNRVAIHLEAAVEGLVTEAITSKALGDRIAFSKFPHANPALIDGELVFGQNLVGGWRHFDDDNSVAVFGIPLVNKLKCIWFLRQKRVFGEDVLFNFIEIVVHSGQ